MDEERLDGDERGRVADADESVRRSSYRAPGSPWSAAPSESDDSEEPQLHSDDELADMLAEEVARFTSSMPVITPQMLRDYSYPGAELLADEAPGGGNEQSVSLPPPTEELSASAGLDALLLLAPPPAPGSVATPPPGSMLPERPRRRSLDDDDLATVVRKEAQRTGSTGGAIDELEAQLRLRGEEAREFFTWEQSMRAIGTPEALDAIERARPAFTGVIPILGAMPPRTMEPIAPEPLWSPETSADAPATVGGSVPAVPEAGIDDIDIGETDRAWPAPSPGSTITSEPIPTPIDPEADLLGDGSGAPPQRVFSVEEDDGEPTALQYRAGRAARLFWLWFAANSSVVGVAFGAAVFSLGMSLRQALVATLAGVALSFIPLALASLAGKWNGQPTMVVSRAAFGVVGNIVPASIAVLTRVFWGAAMLWAFAAGSSGILQHSGVAGGRTGLRFTLVALAVGFMLALVVAFFGYALISRVYLVFSILSGLLIVALVALTWPAVDVEQALSTTDGPWMLVITGAVLVFSFVGLAWANSGADVARYQRPGGSGAASMAWAAVGTTLPSFVLIAYGSLLAASSPELASGLAARPLEPLAGLLPGWFVLPLLASVGLSLVCGAVLTIYSGAFALQSAGVRLRRPAAVVVVGVLIAGAALGLTFAIDDFLVLFRDIATTLAVPVAAWTGIFAADMMIRNRRFDGASLIRRGGIYGDVNWVNLALLLVATVIGFGLTTAVADGLEWQGYLFPLLGVPLDGVVAESDFGVIVALLVGLATPLVSGVPRIRRQEQARG